MIFSLSKFNLKKKQIIWLATAIDLFQFLIRFFTKYPEYQKLFKSFATLPLNELNGNKRVLAHGLNVIYTLSAVIDSIEDAELFTEVILTFKYSNIRSLNLCVYFK